MQLTVHNAQRFVGWFAVAIAFGSAAIGYYGQQDSNNRAACQTRINQEFLAVIKERAKVGNANTKNINDLIQEVFSTKDPKVALADYQKYLKELAVINGELQRDTFPDIGSC